MARDMAAGNHRVLRQAPDIREASPADTISTEATSADLRSQLSLKAQASSWLFKYKDIQIEKELCRTLKSTVQLGKWKGASVVVKTFLVANCEANKGTQEASSASVAEELLHEIDLLSSVRHPDLVMFLGACLDTTTSLACVTEFMPGGDLESYYIAKRQKHQVSDWHPSLKQVVQWGSSIARGLFFLHTRDVPIVHRDLKPLNLLLTKHLELKIADLGVSRVLAAGNGDPESYTMSGGVGTLRYMAPEVARHQLYDEKVDIYALALILYFLSSGRQPFHQLGDPEFVLQLFVQGEEPRPVLAECPSKLRHLIAAGWAAKAAERPDASTMLSLLEDLEAQVQPACLCAQM